MEVDADTLREYFAPIAADLAERLSSARSSAGDVAPPPPYLSVLTHADFALKAAHAHPLHGLRHRERQSALFAAVDALGWASATAQHLKAPITSAKRMIESDHTLYLLAVPKSDAVAPAGAHGGATVVGLLKVGRKRLFFTDEMGEMRSSTPLCVLDFYVHTQVQRRGHGLALFRAMLSREHADPADLAYDRPSPKLVAFLDRQFGLAAAKHQPNHFAVFQRVDCAAPRTDSVLALTPGHAARGGVRSRARVGPALGDPCGHAGVLPPLPAGAVSMPASMPALAQSGSSQLGAVSCPSHSLPAISSPRKGAALPLHQENWTLSTTPDTFSSTSAAAPPGPGPAPPKSPARQRYLAHLHGGGGLGALGLGLDRPGSAAHAALAAVTGGPGRAGTLPPLTRTGGAMARRHGGGFM